MTTPHDDETLTAALVQISGHAERIAALDDRYRDLADALTEIADRVAATSARADSDAAGTAGVLASLDVLEHEITALAIRLDTLPAARGYAIAGPGQYQPVRAPRWWKITGPERDAALDRLRAWVSHVYRPSYGQLAALLPACWEDHPLCLHILDWLSELWSVLYLAPERTPEILAGQAEWQTRLLPAAADQMAVEADGCQHARRIPPERPPRVRRTD